MTHLDPELLVQPARLAAVRRTRQVLPGTVLPLDAVARLAAHLVQAPVAAICLVGGDDDLIVGAHGIPAPLLRNRRVPMDHSVGKYVIGGGPVTVVTDVRQDPELRGHPLVHEIGLRAFLGVPLTDAAGNPVGSVVTLDVVPRHWSPTEVATVREIAAVVTPQDLFAEPPTGQVPDIALGPLLESTLEAFVAADVDGVVVGWNLAAEVMFGWTAAEAVGRRLADLFVPEGGGALLPERDLAAVSRPQRRARGTGRHRDGHPFPAEAFLTRVPSPAGPLLCGFFLDVTEQTALRREKVQRGRFLDALLDSLLAGVMACDPRGHVVVLNRLLRELLGLPDDWRPFPLTQLASVFTDVDRHPLAPGEAPLARAFRGECVRSQLVRLPAAGSRPARDFLANAHPILDADGSSLGAVAALHDITAHLRQQRLSLCQLEVARKLAGVRSVEDALHVVLRSIADALGWRRGEAWLRDPVVDALQPVAAWTGDPAGAGGWRGGDLARRCSAEVRTIHRDDGAGGPAIAVPITENRTALGALVLEDPGEGGAAGGDDVAVDFAESISAHLTAFLSRRRADALRVELGRSKDDFIALAGHALRTPLTSIGSYADLLRAGAERWDDDERQMLDAISRNTEGLRAIVDDLLDLAAMESGHADMAVQPVDLAALVRQEEQALGEVAARSGVRVRDALPGSLPVRGDPDRLRLLIRNLLSNAVKYSPDGGVVDVAAGTDASAVELTIADGGVGIPPEERERLFRRFFRASNALDRGIPGTGLGLSISRAIVEAHGGTLSLRPREPAHAGTTVTVRLPAG
ncbi:MAG TPA: ATP-binding protein [Pilimelia sp.]|nr:ATP-binding protein [Pilimelia sp.]